VGDTLSADVEGPRAAGMQAMLISEFEPIEKHPAATGIVPRRAWLRI
jgi:FMN phosphatase YigB (HAD superfamily)